MFAKILFASFSILINISCFAVEAKPPLPLAANAKEKHAHVTEKTLSSDEQKATTKVLSKENNSVAEEIQLRIGVSKKDNDIYLPLASTICIFMNENRSSACRIKQYEDTLHSISGLLNGDVDVILADSLLGKFAVSGSGPFKENMQYNKIRFIASMFNEKLILLARKDAKINQLNDLQNNSVNIARAYTKPRMLFEDLMRLKKWQLSDFKQATEFEMSDAVKAVCDGGINAIAIVAEEMNENIKEATRICELNPISLSDDEIQLFNGMPEYVRDKIIGGLYVGIPRDVPTIAIRTILLSTSDVKNSQIEFLMKVINEYLKEIQLLHPALADLSMQKMLTLGKVAHFHDGVTDFIKKNDYGSILQP